MENPESRPPVAQLINSVIYQHQEDIQRGVIGQSLCMNIYHVLKEAGYLVKGA